MAVVGVARISPDQDGWTAQLGQTQHQIYIKYVIQTDDYGDGPLTALTADELPLVGASYATGNDVHPFAICRSLGNARRIAENSLWWHVDVEFSTPVPKTENPTSGGTKEAAGQADDPLLMFPSLEMRSEEYEQTVFGVFDIATATFQPCKNTAGEVFDPAPTRKECTISMVFVKNNAIVFNVAQTIIDYVNYINSDVFFGFPPGTVRCTGITASKESKQRANKSVYEYLKCQYSFAVKQTWHTFILNAGTFFLQKPESMIEGDESKKVKFTDEAGHPITGALKADGTRLKPTDTPVFLEYAFYNVRPFAPLGLPISWATVG